MTDTDVLSRLRALVGATVRYGEQRARILELLMDEQALVLEVIDGDPVIQANQFGDATRRVGRTVTLPIYAADSDELNPVLQTLRVAEPGH